MPYLQCQMSKPILCCAIAACPLDHRDANASVMKYLTDFLACATKKEVRKFVTMTDFSASVARNETRISDTTKNIYWLELLVKRYFR